MLHLTTCADLPGCYDLPLLISACCACICCAQVTAEILQRYLELEASLLLGWLMKFPGGPHKNPTVTCSVLTYGHSLR
jgi:hypothetical protein